MSGPKTPPSPGTLVTPPDKRDSMNERLRAHARRPASSSPAIVVEQPASVKHRDLALERAARQSDAHIETKETIGAVIAHNGRIELSQRELRDDQRDLAAAVSIIGRELGVQHMFPASVRASVPPPPGGAAAPRRTLPALSRNQRIATLVVVAVETAHLVRDLLHALHVLK